MGSGHKMVVLIIFWLSMAKPFGDEGKVKVSLYYESLCPNSADFIVNQLGKALFHGNLISIVDLKMVPWGNAKLFANHSSECQHGPDECMIDIAEACAIELLPKSGQNSFQVIECIEDLYLHGKHGEWESCINSLKICPNPIMDCYKSGMGIDLELKFVDETIHLNPPHRFVPWVIVNDKPLQEKYGKFVTYICNAYDGKNKPKACDELLETEKLYPETSCGGDVEIP